MSLWKERIMSFFRHKKPSTAAAEANRSADTSLEQAREDLLRVQTNAQESKLVASRLREHNVANHYDDWLSEQFLKYYGSTVQK